MMFRRKTEPTERAPVPTYDDPWELIELVSIMEETDVIPHYRRADGTVIHNWNRTSLFAAQIDALLSLRGRVTDEG